MFEWPHLLKVAIFHKSGFPANRVEPTHPVDMECPLTILNLCQRPLLKWTSEAQLQCRRVNWQHNLVEMIKLRSLSKSLWFSCTVPTTYKANNFVQWQWGSKHETSTSYSSWRKFAITLHSRNLYLLFPLTAICYHDLGTITPLAIWAGWPYIRALLPYMAKVGNTRELALLPGWPYIRKPFKRDSLYLRRRRGWRHGMVA